MRDQAIILLAEDREDDVLLIKHAFAKANIPNPLYIVRDGDEAIAYLKGEGKFANRAEYPLPDLLLLDLKMPRTNGFEVIKWVREQPTFGTLRILVLTSSQEMQDVNNAYLLGANSFLVKPHDFEDFLGLSRIIQDFWLRMSKAPNISRPARDSKNSDSKETNGRGS